MDRKENNESSGSRKKLLKQNDTQPEDVAKAHEEAEKDMNEDAEFTAQSPNDDLDEGETARLGENP